MVNKSVLREERLKKKARKTSIFEGSFYSVSDGFGLRNVTPYLLEVGKNSPYINFFVGLLSSIPTFLGNLAQIFSSRLIEKHPRKKIVSFGVFIQAFMWLVLLIPGLLFFYFGKSSTFSSLMVVILYSLFVVFGSLATPAWVSWMKDLVSEKNRGAYSGRRNKIVGLVAFIFALIGGFILDYFKHTTIFIAFIILFGISFIFRGLSGYMFTRQYEPKIKLSKEYYFSFWQFIKKMHTNNFGTFTYFISFFWIAVNLFSPFAAVYLLADLKLSYAAYTAITLCAAFFGLISMKFWGRTIDQYGAVKIMNFSGFFIPLIPLFYLLSIFFIGDKTLLIFYMCAVESFSGFAWAGFNSASGNFIYNAVSRERIAICISYHGTVMAIFAAAGSFLGGIIASVHIPFLFSTILLLMLLSSIARFAVYFIFLKKIREVREVSYLDVNKNIRQRIIKVFRVPADFINSIYERFVDS